MDGRAHWSERPRKRTLLDRPIWVALRKLFQPGSSNPPGRQIDALVDVTVDVEGVLLEWERGSDGQWLAVVNYDVVNGAGRRTMFTRQLVPAEAIRPRKFSAYPNEGPW